MTRELIPVSERERLRDVSGRLLHLHKLLLDRQRGVHEIKEGRHFSSGELLQLVLENQDFAWLRQLSGAIVQIDEMLAPRSTAGVGEANATLEFVSDLLTPREDGTAFQQKYWGAIQENTDVLIAHGEIRKLLKRD